VRRSWAGWDADLATPMPPPPRAHVSKPPERTALMPLAAFDPNDPDMTKPQRRALMWLPADGSWVVGVPRSVAAAVDSLCLFYRDAAQTKWGRFGPRGGWCRRARLLPRGVAMRAALTPQTPAQPAAGSPQPSDAPTPSEPADGAVAPRDSGVWR
jgi:hypothetical protein